MDLSQEIEVEPTTPAKKRMKLEGYAPVFIIEKDKNSKSVPDPFPFPEKYTPEVAMCISRQFMPPQVVEKVITCLARAVFAHKYYPTKSELEQVAAQAVQKYPFVKAPAGLPYVSLYFVPLYLCCYVLINAGAHLVWHVQQYERISTYSKKHGLGQKNKGCN